MNLTKLLLLEQYLTENSAKPRFSVPFLTRKNTHNVELQNWKDYQDLRKGTITIRQSGIRVKSPDYYPCLTYNPVIPIIYESGYRYLNQQELLALQSFPPNYQFPTNYSLSKIASLLGNSINLEALRYFLRDKSISNLKFIDLFSGLGAFHLTLKGLGNECVLALDQNKSCQATYQLNFSDTPFLLGNINDKDIQKKVIQQEFDLLCAGFPCQPFSKAGKKTGQSLELTSLLTIIKKKQPLYLLLETVPHFCQSSGTNELLFLLLSDYQIQMSIINPKDLAVKQNRPRLFIWGQRNFKLYE